MAVLREQRTRAEVRTEALGVELADDAFVWSQAADHMEPWRPDRVSGAFTALRNREHMPHVCLNDLRHFSATQLVAAGLDPGLIAGRLGDNASVLLRIYGHVVPARDQAAAEMVGPGFPGSRSTFPFMDETPKWHFGNAAIDGAERRGWMVGPFMDPDDVRMTEAVEIKWGNHAAGDRRESWFEQEARTTVLLLVKGRFRVDLSVGTAVLAEEGDYAMWGPGIGHSWRAEEDSVVVTIRWPGAV